MQRGGRGGNNLFGGFGASPFGNDPFGSIFNGGRDPFDDPFFTRPFSNINSMFPSMFGGPHSLFNQQQPFNNNFIEPQHQQQPPSRGVTIEEISDDDEEEGKERSRKHARDGGEAYVEEPDEDEERRVRYMQHNNIRNRNGNGSNDWVQRQQPQGRSFSFSSSSVTYGGVNGAYYTSSTTRKMGDNGVILEEKKEADTATGKAEHRVSKGIHDKGHTVTRKLNPDGKVDTMQTLHNLNEDELDGFQETWKGNARKHLPGWTEGNDLLGNDGQAAACKHRVRAGPFLLQSKQVAPVSQHHRRLKYPNGGVRIDLLPGRQQHGFENH